MSGVQKFMFDVQFDAPAVPAEPEVVQEEVLPELPPEPVAPTFSEQELEEAKRRAWDDAMAEGQRQGRDDAMSGIEQLQSKLLENMVHRLGDLLAEQATRFAQQREMTLRIALAIMRKVLPAYTQKHGLAEIEALVNTIASQISDEPRLVVRVADSQLDAVSTRIKAELERAGYEGKVVFMSEAALGTSDCLIEWADGGAERDEARLWGDIDRLVAQVLHQAPSQPGEATTTSAE